MSQHARALAAAATCVALACYSPPGSAPAGVSPPRVVGALYEPPPTPSPQQIGLIGEYDAPAGMRIVLEDKGALYIADTNQHRAGLIQRDTVDQYKIVPSVSRELLGVPDSIAKFDRDETGRAIAIIVGDTRLPRRNIEPAPGTNQLRVTPLRPLSELRTEALAAKPPEEQGPFRPVDLVELTRLDATIHLEIRYATTNNFLGTRFYDEARAFMQRPAAEAVVRANHALHELGYGLLIHDAYRPWYVTKMFWDATPPEKRWLVADPSQGSRHNRGAAVDLTIYQLATGEPVEMPSTYDESTDRAYANYPGGTTRQRWYRALLRRTMEAQGFTVNPTEWWHFDYQDWRAYPIVNVPFNALP